MTDHTGDVDVRADIEYARRPTGALHLDLFRPRGDHPVPVVLWLHGGGWFTGDKTLAPDLAARARATGCAMAAVDYRLSGQAKFPAQLIDVRDAIRYLRASAGDLGIAPNAVGAWGASAGGHLAALAGVTGHLPVFPGEGASSVDASLQAVAASYAPVDLAAVVAASGSPGDSSPEAGLLGGIPAELPEAARAASPLSWITGAAPPFQLSHGTGDVLVPHSESEHLYAALTGAGVPAELYLLDGYRHGFLNPAGRLDLEMSRVMDDGKLAAHGEAAASFRSSGHPEPVRAAFGFDTIDSFLRNTLTHTLRTGDHS